MSSLTDKRLTGIVNRSNSKEKQLLYRTANLIRTMFVMFTSAGSGKRSLSLLAAADVVSSLIGSEPVFGSIPPGMSAPLPARACQPG